ncbi:hypothetical protein AB0B44_33035, partial [Streptomyces sp. NPDC041003]
MITTVEQLLSALDSLPHKARLRHTAVAAHALAARGELRPLLTALDRLGPYERRLGALAALAGADTDHLAALLADPDPVVRRYALRGARAMNSTMRTSVRSGLIALIAVAGTTVPQAVAEA